ncbi:MAG: penicillin-binding protein 1A [Cyclobacteriaceae bacterium]|nr:MAG: penicillin-binding protein 1A [Cyclobacteriaceae bacterium]
MLASGFYFLVYLGIFGKVPDTTDILNYQNNTASEVYSMDGVLLGKYFLQDRTNASFEDLPTHLIDALIATEDVRFYQHDGVDYQSLVRVAVKTLIMGDRSSGGGSTLTQQLAKNLFPRDNQGMLALPVSKIKEMIVAGRIEQVYKKEEILTLYLNTVSFGYNAFGIETASVRFFNKPPKELTLEESAVLVGMLKATTLYNPKRNPEKSLERRNVVFNQMEKYGYLYESQVDSLKAIPLEIDFTLTNHNEGIATYFREYLRGELQNWCRSHEKEDGDNYNLYTDGLKIYTTIHSKMQTYAEKAVSDHMSELQSIFNKHWEGSQPWSKNRNSLISAIHKSERYKKLKDKGHSENEIQEIFKQPVPMTIFTWNGEQDVEISPLDSVKHYLYFLNAGFMAMDPHDGSILSWVGGINHKYFQYDHVNIGTKRQVGSVFKPVVYAAALENGVKPCDFVASRRITYRNFDDWSPGNADENYDGYYSVQGALTNSVNTVSVKVLERTKIKNAVRMAQKMGIESEIPEVPSIALGTPNLSLYEMVGAYSTFVNDGQVIKPRYLLRIETQNGEVLEEFVPADHNQRAMSKRTSELMLQMLRQVVDRGTAQRLRTRYNLPNDIAGKTGTTQSHADGWFIGITPDIVAGAWVGSDDPNIHFRSITHGQGAAMALPIWGLFMQQINQDKSFSDISRAKFNPISYPLDELLDCEDYKDRRSVSDIFKHILSGKKNNKKSRKTKRRVYR